MANSESQEKTIGLVFVVLLMVVFASLTYYYHDQIGDLEDQAKQAKSSEQQAKATVQTAQDEYRQFRVLVQGSESEKDHDAFLAQLDARRNSPTLSKQRLEQVGSYATLRAGIEYLQTQLKETDQQISTLEEQKRQKEEELKQVHGKILAETQNELAAQQAEHKKFITDREQLIGNIDDKENLRDKLYGESIQDEEALTKLDLERNLQNEGLDRIKRGLGFLLAEIEKQRTEQENITFEKEDGQILDLIKSTDYAYVDVGRLDGLRVGQTFGIHGKNVGGNPQHLPKAKLEIVQLAGDHHAVGVITDQDFSDPVLPHDLLNSTAWSPGQMESVAFVGLIHLDEDAKPDNERFRQWLLDNGATIDAEFDLETGTKRGEVGVATDWLILGDFPEPGSSEETRNELLRDAMQEMQRQARDRNVTIVNVRNFSNYMINQTRNLSLSQSGRSRAPAALTPGSSVTTVGTQSRDTIASPFSVGTQRRHLQSSPFPVGTQRRHNQSSPFRVGTQR